MGYVWLRIIVWFVVVTAMLGNLIVLIVTLSSKHKLTVPKFLMCNLTTADFFLGFYLLSLAAYDYYTRGVYFNYAITWQYEIGCNLVGFLSTFSTVLSVYTLTVLTIERWYAISHAINITKRIRLKQASYIMIGGWIFALTFATLPLLGVSNFNKTSICLPMETETKIIDKVYVFTLLFLHLACFVVICVCYVDMYRQVHTQRSAVEKQSRQSAVGKKDANIAKRMAILVFTDFACLFPIAFFGLTAAAGQPLITLTQSKILLVFFFPLNACANPFLYAITTQQFKKDLLSTLGRCGVCEKRARRYRGPYGNAFQYSSSNPHSRPCRATTGNFVHRSSQGSVKSNFLSFKLSSSTTSHGSHGTPNSSPKTSKKKILDSMISTATSAPPICKHQTVLCTGTAAGISKDLRKLSIVPEVSPKRGTIVSIEEEQCPVRGSRFEVEVDQSKKQDAMIHVSDKAAETDHVAEGLEDTCHNQINKPSDHFSQNVQLNQSERNKLEKDQTSEYLEANDEEGGELVSGRTVRSVSQYSGILGKRGSVEYDRRRKGSHSTSTSGSSGYSGSSAGSGGTEISELLPVSEAGSTEGKSAIETIEEEESVN